MGGTAEEPGAGNLGKLGEWLRKERQSIQMSQEQLERESGVPQSTISVLERGRAPLDSGIVGSLRQLTETLGVSLLQAYHIAGLLEFTDAADRDAAEAAILVRGMNNSERRRAMEWLRSESGSTEDVVD